ncbi:MULTISPECIES: D-allulose 6-phosphate 3-epimerase [Aerococcus]|uniref:D-allulose 6-phosphate 3-epimerase n=1 Tax=Aerococcus TaxID=1375 RepID=UPI000DCCEF88|nr:D-allulose 6-phosphate 3-epimerase [Aerococcus urinae]RAV93832.1 allulose-6-phosphate 3-epimerase [Aerococcus mictus]MDK6375277.1 D-allulose 6-phosphate 3-epimerase [Aerococcus urinae]MDK6420125.1 D-allulose 6-phosphate 3-epimerase [Aerococcus urinae]MDK8075618.1 D-allulose 6-phosphate 3-epimerase [Aerococcus urinae]MDK8084613.1 D-allulose 6-phosphate 3-epimerase [Aerococcus urinae]
MVKLSPSLMCMNLTQFSEQINILNKHVDYYHVDIMDGHYVKNITLSPWFISELKKITNLPIDAHMMVTNPEQYIDELLSYNTDQISIHADCLMGQAFRIAQKIHDSGKRFGVVLNPELPINNILDYIDHVDSITIMTVDPGYAGQPFIPEALDKVKKLIKLREENNYSYNIQIDGSCNQKTYEQLSNAGAEVLILGSSGLFNLSDNITKSVEIMKKQVSEYFGEQ